MSRRTMVLPSVIPVSNENVNGRYMVHDRPRLHSEQFPNISQEGARMSMSKQVLVFLLHSFDSLARNTTENSR